MYWLVKVDTVLIWAQLDKAGLSLAIKDELIVSQNCSA